MFHPLNLPAEDFLYGLNQTVSDPPSKFVEWHEFIAFRYSGRLQRVARPHVAEWDTAQRRSRLGPDGRKALDER